MKNMQEKFVNYIEAFKKLNSDDKKSEIMNNIRELKSFVELVNKRIGIEEEVLPVIEKYETEEEFLEELFTYIISLKEENGKFLKKMIDERLI